jgi:hypothetical protein
VVAGLNRLGCELNAGIYKNQSLFGGGGLDKESRFLDEGRNIFNNTATIIRDRGWRVKES